MKINPIFRSCEANIYKQPNKSKDKDCKKNKKDDEHISFADKFAAAQQEVYCKHNGYENNKHVIGLYLTKIV